MRGSKKVNIRVRESEREWERKKERKKENGKESERKNMRESVCKVEYERKWIGTHRERERMRLTKIMWWRELQWERHSRSVTLDIRCWCWLHVDAVGLWSTSCCHFASCWQCGQIGQFLKFLAANFLFKVTQIHSTFWLLLSMSLLKKKLLLLHFGQVLEKLGYF